LLKNSTIVEVVKSHLAPQRALDLLVVSLSTRNPRDYINKENAGIEPATSEGELTN
jgi:hypothetical protein